jgi:hypothetical protein
LNVWTLRCLDFLPTIALSCELISRKNTPQTVLRHAEGFEAYYNSWFFPFQKDGRIDIEELESQYSNLGYKSRKMTEYGCSEVEDVIWEVSCIIQKKKEMADLNDIAYVKTRLMKMAMAGSIGKILCRSTSGAKKTKLAKSRQDSTI